MENRSKTFSLGELTLVSGVGDYSKAEACVMSAAAAWHAMQIGEPLTEATDRLDYACPVVRELCIRRNDGPWASDEERTLWGRGIILRIPGSRADAIETSRRAFRCADVAVRVIAANILDLREANGGKLRKLPAIIDESSARYAADAAKAAAYAAGSGYLANAAVKAAADAAYAAKEAYAVYAAAKAAYAAAAWRPIEELIQEFLAKSAFAPTKQEISRCFAEPVIEVKHDPR